MNNFMPYSYQNYGYQQPQRPVIMQSQYQMPMQQQMAQMQAQPQMQQLMQQPIQQATMPIDTPIQCVVSATLKETEAYILAPNTKGLFIDKTNGMIYEKVCSADGQSFISHYKKVESQTEKQYVETTKEDTALDMTEFARKSDLNGFVTQGQYENLKDIIKSLQAQINGSKQTIKTKAEKTNDKGEE